MTNTAATTQKPGLVEVPLTDPAVLVGRNGVGKSRVLDEKDGVGRKNEMAFPSGFPLASLGGSPPVFRFDHPDATRHAKIQAQTDKLLRRRGEDAP